MKALPDGRDKLAEEEAFLSVCHATRNRRARTAEILHAESFFDASARPTDDVWDAFYASEWDSPSGKVRGAEIHSALKKHLIDLQKGNCCYCGQPMQPVGHARPLDHVLPRVRYPRFTLYFWNLAVACRRCNQIKTERDKNESPFNNALTDYPEPDEFHTLFHPRLHRRADHVKSLFFGDGEVWFTQHVGQTPQGRHLVQTILIKASDEELRLSAAPELNQALADIRKFSESQNEDAVDMVTAFASMCRDVFVDGAPPTA